MTIDPVSAYTFPPNIQPKGSYYLHPDFGPLIRTTAFLKAYGGKGEKIADWTGKKERRAAIAAGDVIYNQPERTANFPAAVEAIMGQALAAVAEKEKAGDIGTAIHKRIKFDLSGDQGTPPPLTENSTIGYMAYRQWWAQAGIQIVRSEQFVFCPKLQAAGTVDVFGLRGGKLGIVDFKSSAGVYDDHHLQLMAYVIMSRACGLPVEWAELIHLPKTLETAFRPIVPIPLGELTWWQGRPQKHLVPLEQLERCVWSARILYKHLMEG